MALLQGRRANAPREPLFGRHHQPLCLAAELEREVLAHVRALAPALLDEPGIAGEAGFGAQPAVV